MKKEELDKKYGKKLVDKIIRNGYLDGCTVKINQDGSEDIPEEDIRFALREMSGEKISDFEWD
jgi:hypothetical protein